MARTLADAQAELVTIEAALSSIYAGTRLTTLIVGSGEYQRRYSYQELKPEFLESKRRELNAEIISLTPNAEPTYSAFSSIPMVIGKRGIF